MTAPTRRPRPATGKRCARSRATISRTTIGASGRSSAATSSCGSRPRSSLARRRTCGSHASWSARRESGSPSIPSCGRGPAGGELEREQIRLTEIDANGRLRASINFDLDDRRAAFDEAQARFVAGEAATVGGQASIAAFGHAIEEHDWVGLRACLADDLLLRDHRTLGLLGTLGADQWVESLRIQADLAPDLASEQPQILAWNRHGRVDVIRVFGTMREGGPFENVFLGVFTTGGDRIRGYEIFAVGAADQALARFAELCAEGPSASTSP